VWTTAAAAGLLLTSLGACAGPADPQAALEAPPASRAPATPAALATPAAEATPAPRATPADTTPAAAAPATAARACAVPASVRAAQVLIVRAAGTRAGVTACARTPSGGYVRALGPYAGHVGRGGVAPAGAKREGDGRTPRGVFPLRGGFGVADPGTSLPWLRVGPRDVWVDDPRSRLYNTHQVLPARGRWRSAELLRIPAYEYAQVIGYNESRRPGLGSAIFLHVDTGRPTAGCVSLPREALVRVLRWQRPGAAVVIG
jgi:L,D-peptidoglycan transpeptidase YkuD (ErfK/YbiS/YcfS/YnhG family)